MDWSHVPEEGGRERKRRETHRRITETALQLFTDGSYETTTLDAIAAEAGIARRTFFHYFRSKEEIILAWQNALPGALHDAIIAQDARMPPLAAVERGLLALSADMPADIAVMVNRIVRADVQLQASNHAKFLNMERAAYEALCTLRPDDPEPRALRLSAMIGVGIMRLSVDDWSAEGGVRPLSVYIADQFAAMPQDLSPDPA